VHWATRRNPGEGGLRRLRMGGEAGYDLDLAGGSLGWVSGGVTVVVKAEVSDGNVCQRF